MSNIRAAYRYALSCIDVAEEASALEAVYNDFKQIDQLIVSSRDFLNFLKSPVVNSEKKKRMLKEILENKVSKTTMTFVLLLASKGRVAILPEIIRQFYQLRDERLNTLNVTARIAVALTPAQEQQLVGRIETATGKKVRMSYIIDPLLKGGFTVQHNDTVWDASVRHQLDLLRERFAEGV